MQRKTRKRHFICIAMLLDILFLSLQVRKYQYKRRKQHLINTNDTIHRRLIISYLCIILSGESDFKRKESLRLRINDYIKRAEVLKALCMDNSNDKDKCVPAEDKGNSSIQKISSLNGRLSIVYDELRLYPNFYNARIFFFYI